MNSKQLWATAAAIFAFIVFDAYIPGVWAQSSSMAACHSGWDWNQNSLSQDPCVISSKLDAACRSLASYTIPPLNSTLSYYPPQRNSTSDLTCDCDTVMYSLYMACTSCQGAIMYPWPTWMAQCDTVYVSQYPHDVAQGTTIPRWAFFNITNLPDQLYNDTVARAIGRNPEATPRPISTISLSSSTPTPSSTPAFSSPFPIITSGGSGGKSNTGAIVGGVVGGVAGLLALVAAALFFMRRRTQRGTSQLPPPPPQTPVTSEYYKVQPASPVYTPSSPNPHFNAYYNPQDPSTFPPPMSDGQSSLTYGTQSHNPGRYSGMPEIS